MNGSPESPRSESARSVKVPTSTSQGRLKQERVLELFDYRGDGKLIRKVAVGRGKIGQAAGNKTQKGYLIARVDKKTYRLHRLVWLWHYGYMPENGLDHINRKPTDNRIENLREVGRSCNMRNTGTPRNNRCGVKGVGWHKEGSVWRSRIRCKGRTRLIGGDKDFNEAVCLRLAAEQALGWEGCDSSSPAYRYVRRHVQGLK